MGCTGQVTTTTTPTIEELPIATNVQNFGSYDELRAYLTNLYDETETGYLFKNFGAMDEVYSSVMDDAAMNDALEGSGTEVDRTHSETNNQVEGVSEYDTVLTDGYHIFITTWSDFFILNADTLEIEYTMNWENGSFYGMFLEEERLVLIGSEYTYDESEKTDEDRYYWYHYTYGVKIQVLDVSNVDAETAPTLEKELFFDNSYLADARMLDGYCYLIMDNYVINYGFSGDSFIPIYRDSDQAEGDISLSAENIYVMPNDNYSINYLLLASFNVHDDEAAQVDAYLGSTYQIYMSTNNLYTVMYRYSYDEETGFYDYTTYILRFAVSDSHALVFQAIGEVEGSPLNQFSMDEYVVEAVGDEPRKVYFRIATTGNQYDQLGNWSTTNTVFILDGGAVDEMAILGQIGGLGKPLERITSVRFNGDEAFVVTYYQTDPLIWLNLSDPTNPVIRGELEEDGFSTYLHVINEDLILGIGNDSETVDGMTRTLGVKAELYRAVGENLTSLEIYTVEGQYSYTNVSWDHKAFMSFEPEGEDFMYVGIPIMEYEQGWYGYSQSLYVFKVYFTGDLELVAKLSHMDEDISEGFYWYFDSIERSLIIGSNIYTVSNYKIQMYDMSNGFEFVAKTELSEENRYYFID
jgi:uncharacterized secreted protein with C-terminal beta-propeller domain